MKVSNICRPIQYTNFGANTETYKHNGRTIKVNYDDGGSVAKTAEYDKFDRFVEGITFDDQYNVTSYHSKTYDDNNNTGVEYYIDNGQEYVRTTQRGQGEKGTYSTETFDSKSDPTKSYKAERIFDESGHLLEMKMNGKTIFPEKNN